MKDLTLKFRLFNKQIFLCYFDPRTLLGAILRKMCHVLMVNVLILMEKACVHIRFNYFSRSDNKLNYT